MSSMASSIKLPVDLRSEKYHLHPFPIVQTPSGEDGKGSRLVKQLRIKNLMPRGSTEQPITFLNTYGFVRPMRTHGEFFSEFHRPDTTPCVTACMLPFGAGPFLDNPTRLIDEIDKAHIIIRKSASYREEIIFDIKKLPSMLTQHQLAQDKIICVSSEKFLKSPGKVTSGVDYLYSITFMSITYCPASYKFRVSRPLQIIRAKAMRSVHLEIMMRIECKKDSPLLKNMITTDGSEGGVVSVWFHICNLYKGNNPAKEYDDSYFSKKCKQMDIECGIVDMWGPTLMVHAHGHIPKMAKPFFNRKGWACYPFSDAAAGLSKTLWSVGATIVEVNAILQASDLAQLTHVHDIIYPKVKLSKELVNYQPSKWNPLKKIVSI
ncbi:matrix protein [Achimota virus 2]|uniref:Matrix protein n=1 Tax=Achimota virus 2 TaxID=1261101 RepID=K7XAR3_9MONO|nr:matrix protein [Achimota virus 2]AFX75115.1 matrix protein [Achimota virus 2]